MKGKTNFRQVIYIIHLWVGIPCALFLFVMCLSGTAYVFNKEITRWLDKDKYAITPPANQSPLPASQLVAILQNIKPDSRIATIQIPKTIGEAWLVGFLPRISPKTKKTKADQFWVNPYTGQLLGNAQTPTSKTFATILQLHRWLLIDNHDIGEAITGAAAMLMVLLQLTGLILWLPAKFKQWKKWNMWRQGFFVNVKASAKRVNFDLHKTLGFYAFVFVTIMALTGPIFGFEWYRNGFNKMLGAKAVDKKEGDNLRATAPSPDASPLSLESLTKVTDSLYPYRGTTTYTIPKEKSGVITIARVHEGFFASPGPDRVLLDPYSGNIIKLDRFADKSTGQKISQVAKAIHTGEIVGVFSKILYFIACLLATSLPITGVIIWWGRRNKKKKNSSMPQRLENPNTIGVCA